MSGDAALVLATVRVPGRSEIFDVVLDGGSVAAITPAGACAHPGVRRVELDGRWLVPGLVDRHVHFSQWAQASRRLDLSGAGSADAVLARVASALDAGEGELVGAGFRDALWPDAPTVAALDAVSGERPVVLSSGDVHSAWLNSAALRRAGFDPASVTGPLREDDAFAVLRSLAVVPDGTLDEWVAAAARAAAARGTTGVVDFEMRWNLDDWRRRAEQGFDALRVAFGVYTQDLDRAIAAGLATGNPVDGTDGLITVGPYKVITDGSLNTRTAWCFDPYPGLEHDDHPAGLATVPPERLVPLIRHAWAHGLVPAVHAIGDLANARALDAFEEVGAPGSIEHAQLLRREDLPRFAALGVVASVQPEHAIDDRDVAERYWAGRTERAFMLADLVRAGAELAFGSDAPVAPLDPWIGIAAAVGRTREGRPPWHPEQALDVRAALTASTGGRAEVEAGSRADLAVLDRDPFAASLEELRAMPVHATLLGGRFTHRSS